MYTTCKHCGEGHFVDQDETGAPDLKGQYCACGCGTWLCEACPRVVCGCDAVLAEGHAAVIDGEHFCQPCVRLVMADFASEHDDQELSSQDAAQWTTLLLAAAVTSQEASALLATQGRA